VQASENRDGPYGQRRAEPKQAERVSGSPPSPMPQLSPPFLLLFRSNARPSTWHGGTVLALPGSLAWCVAGMVAQLDFPQEGKGAALGETSALEMLRNVAECSHSTSPMGMRYLLESKACAPELSSHPQFARKAQQMSTRAPTIRSWKQNPNWIGAWRGTTKPLRSCESCWMRIRETERRRIGRHTCRR